MAHLVFPESITATEVYRVLKPLPLAAAKDLAGVLRMLPEQVHPALQKLEEAGWVRQTLLGSCMPQGRPARRWRLSPEALEQEGLTGQTWHEDGNSCEALFWLPKLAWFYLVIGEIRNLGGFLDFLWTDGLAMDAAVRFELGWVALYWSGPQETENEIGVRMSAILDDVGGRSGRPAPAWPSFSVWVVCDQWQKELVTRAASKEWSDSVSIWCVDDGSSSGVMEPRSGLGRGWIQQPVRSRGTGGWEWEPRVAHSIWNQPNGYVIYRMLRLPQNHPAMTGEMGRLDLKEGERGGASEKTLRNLVRKGLLDSERDGKHLRYELTAKGIEVMIRLDKATHVDYRNRALSDSWVTRHDRREHESGAMNLMTVFMDARLPVAPGWRGSLYLGKLTIKPDGIVRLNHGPYGPGWYLLEYELSARSRSKAARKLRAAAALQHLGIRILFVCYNKMAEDNFHAVGGDMGVRMLTTTVERLGLYGPLDNWDCWSMYGEPVRIG